MKMYRARIIVGPLVLIGIASLLVLSSAFAEDKHGQGKSQASVHLWDYCDPVSFNAAFQADVCERDITTGAINVGGFLGELTSDKSVGAWRFSPDAINSDHRPITLALQNMGGETHTFTRVRTFGGGFVDALNQASGNPTPAPECAQMVNGVLTSQPPSADNLFVPAGGTASATVRRNGNDEVRYQCCIHPWMRLVVAEHEDHDHHH